MDDARRLGYVPALDGLRGVAITGVVAYHAFGWPRGGWIGVHLFFVLSGFLITTLMLEEHARAGSVDRRAFYVRRARRLFPALAALLIAYLVISAVRGANGWPEVLRWGFYTGNVYGAFWPDATAHLVGLNHLWSLAQEEQFYLVWPAAFVAVRRARHPVRLLVALVGALMLYRLGLGLRGATDARLYFAPDMNIDGFLLGAALAFRRSSGPIAVPRGFLSAAVTIGVVIGAIFPATAFLDGYTLPLVELASAVVIAAAVTGRLRLPRALVWLGGISYSLYLWHFVVLWEFDWQHPLLAIGVSLAAAYASTAWIERPFRRPRAATGAAPYRSGPTAPRSSAASA